jgi:uncharacterized protein YsxB (DUF464 family)
VLRITIEKFRNKTKINFEGHANYDNYGKDIVCASVSMLYHTLIKGVNNIKPSALQSQNNKIFIDTTHNDINVITQTVILGLFDIAECYPQNVMIKEKKTQ